jgi:osmotically-inducible protein OsmY
MKSVISKYTTPLFIACAIIGTVSITACSSTPTHESTGQVMDDSLITSKIKAKFVADTAVSALSIKVDTYKGVVQLSGFANDRREIDRAVQIAESVNGVTSVRNDIHLKAGG